MNIISVKPFPTSILPAISVEVSQEFEANALGIVIEGSVIAADGRIIGALLPALEPSTNDGGTTHPLAVFKPSSHQAGVRMPSRSIQKAFYFLIEKPLLEHIENLRLRDPKKDAHFSFSFTADYSLLSVSTGTYQLGGPDAEGKQPVLATSRNYGDTGNLNARILVNYPDELLRHQQLRAGASWVIKASDWIHDFAPVLGLGQFLIVEIPQSPMGAVDSSSQTPEMTEFLERLTKAHSVLGQMAKDLQLGEWGNVVEKSRSFWELFTQDSKQLKIQSFIRQLVGKTTGLDEDKSGNLVQGIGRFYGYASDLHHLVNDAGVKSVFTGGKEDAYLVYTMAASVLNVISTKAQRLSV